MKLLVAIKSCKRDLNNGCHDTVRNTWGKDLGSIALRFFTGGEQCSSKGDETVLIVPDDYDSLALKTHKICEWARYTTFDYLFLADTDCCIFPDRFKLCGYEKYDYMGRFNGIFGHCGPRDLVIKLNQPEVLFPNCHSWASGGGYFLSREAFEAVADQEPPVSFGYAEDVFVGQVVGNTPGLESSPWPVEVSKYYTKDGHSRGYDPKSQWMEQTYAAR